MLLITQPPAIQTAQFTISLNFGAGTTTVATATGDLIIDAITLYCSVAGAGLTSLAIQTNQTTNYVVLNSTDGAVANLTAGKVIATTWTQAQPFFLLSGQLIQRTIAGTGTNGTIIMSVRYRGVTTTGSLA